MKQICRHSRSLFFFALVLITFSLFTGCAVIPKPEFTAYREAFTAAREASDQALIEYVATKEEFGGIKAVIQARQKADTDKHWFPKEFKPDKVPDDADQDKEIAIHIKAWDTIARYNDLLLALAEGKNDEQIANSFSTFVDGISTLSATVGASMPGIGAVTPVIGSILELAEKARKREEFAEAIIDGEPIIAAMIELLKDNTETYYKLRTLVADKKLLQLRRSIIVHARSMSLLAAEHAEPDAGSHLFLAREKTKANLAGVLNRLDLGEKKVRIHEKEWKMEELKGSDKDGAPKYSELVQTQLDQLMASVEADAKEHQKVVEKVNLYWVFLEDYVRLLRTMKDGLENVRARLHNPSPQEIREVVRDLMVSSIRIRNQIEELRRK